ncbi:MAG TPA: class I SAM-dependent methyltransferase [Gemmataceae bacterium]|nr:class I SAM-dependent methyltransferase [Gemmataceae bacterium]
MLLATSDIPAEYHDDRLRWWTTNSPSWSAHIDADHNRSAMLEKLARKAMDLAGHKSNINVADLGCGEGAFLRALRKLAPEARMQGIDFCPAMLAEAARRSTDPSVQYALGDLEDPGFALRPCVNLVTSILAMDEMDQLDAAFRNIAGMLAPGGTAMLVVMDPLKERERNREALEDCLSGNSSPDEAVLIVKTFPNNGLAPVAPYSRIVRPLAQYTAAAIAAGLRPGPVEQLSHDVGIGSYSGRLLFDILTFQKAAAL